MYVLHQDSTPASTSGTIRPAGYLTLTLHAHLPYVIHHGTWPHGIEWLHEAAAETYLPLLRLLANLERDEIALHCNLNLSPILLEQLAHPVFRAEFPNYLRRKIMAAREDEAFFLQSGEQIYAETARFWQRFYTQAHNDFLTLDRDIAKAFLRFHSAGLITLLASAATHAYLPLLGTDESVRGQVRTGVATYIRHMGSAPTGLWSPECGSRPAGSWSFPVAPAGSDPAGSGSFYRVATDQVFAESGIRFFFVDTHLVEDGLLLPAPTPELDSDEAVDPRQGKKAAATKSTSRKPVTPIHAVQDTSGDQPSLYHPYFVAGSTAARSICVFPRDPSTGIQVWSGETGYPGDPNYLDFQKKRFPGGHRYWRVTGPHIGLDEKQPYHPEHAAERVREHARHFVSLVRQTLESQADSAAPAILCAPFDADLFGHWWYEGPCWLEAVARELHRQSVNHPAQSIELISAARYLELYPPVASIAMQEGSWGTAGNHQVWLNSETSWTYTQIYEAELVTRQLATAGHWRSSPLANRILKQLCRELLLLESSDWQSLITTAAARDYAERRFITHHEQFQELTFLYRISETHDTLTPDEEERLSAIERRDSIFPDIDPHLWVETGIAVEA